MEEVLETKHHMDHLVHHEGPSKLNTWVAVTSSVLALFAAFTALNAERVFSKALLAKNDAILEQSKASDQWAHYQAKSMKSEIVSLASLIAPNKETSIWCLNINEKCQK